MQREESDSFGKGEVLLPGKGAFTEMMGGDEDLCAGILEAAIEDFDKLQNQITSAIGQMDLQGAGSSLHALRGGAATVEAEKLVSLVRRMESAIADRDEGAIRGLQTTFQETMDRYRLALQQLRAQFP
jgi:HPt (histidine-containing phosphotransfer) domain-containing protein